MSNGPGMKLDVDMKNAGKKGSKPSDANVSTPAETNSSAAGTTASDVAITAAAQVPDGPRADQQNSPVCPLHNCVMLANGTQGATTFYYCQVEGCKESQKMRRNGHAFAKPMLCPMADCIHRNKGKQTAMQIVPNGAQNGQLRMKCPAPECTYETVVLDPRMKSLPGMRPKPPNFDER
jgi:hypothetical protein